MIEVWEICAWGSWIMPIIGALFTPLLAKIGKRVRDYGAVIFSFIAMLMTIQLIPLLFMEVEWPLHSRFPWIIIPDAPILSELEAGILVDPLSIIMANIVSAVSFLIMIYSMGYMHDDPGLTRYWFFMNFFIGNMLLLILSDNLILMMFGWEGVGLCSYALIGYWYQDSREGWLRYWVGEPPEAYPPSHCGMKAFLVTRFGDLLLLAGVLIILSITGTVNFLELGHAVELAPENLRSLLVPAAILLLGGAIGKSAQLPLMEWLPDAMAGPTPVSALIHAATMVKAGVYLVARIFPIMLAWSYLLPEISSFFYVVMWIGAITAFIAATQAMVSTELKKVLAYSTVSQLGYMMLALGAGGIASEFLVGYIGSIFHLMNHAIFKAALFLVAGAVIHECGSRFLRDMGGLRKYMPITFYSMLLAALALMGMPPFGGFWSKDLVLEAALSSGQYIVFAIGLVTAILTAFYSMRAIGLVFFGGSTSKQGGKHIHEAPKIMWIPYLILAAVSLGIGIGAPVIEHGLVEIFKPYLGHGVEEASKISFIVPALSIIALIVGALPSYLLYARGRINAEQVLHRSKLLLRLREIIFRRYYINSFYYKILVNPAIKGSEKMLKVFELGMLDKLNYVIAGAARSISNYVRRIHTGVLNHYIIGLIIGLLVLVWIFLTGGI
ncbi:NADH-quinone oxidoreductase subunit L [Candidatus Bathyarchaeota archaeon]|nr:MAG: NADH-quinone oxidoreductase subunit L [Candidatus Bathyarchaeota archaeon]